MKIGLKSGKSFECDDDGAYTSTDKITGETRDTFISLKNRKKYGVNADDIEFFETKLVDEVIADLATWGCEDEPDPHDHSFG